MQPNGIARLTLDVIPATSTSYAPPEIDLSSSTSQSYTINNLTDNESYVFRILAYNSSNALIWAGETIAVVPPTGTTVTVQSLKVTASSSTYLANAQNLLTSKDPSSANNNLMLAALTDQQNFEAKMYYALNQIANLYATAGSSNSTQLDSIRKILTASGITYLSLNTLSSANHPKVGLPNQLPSTTPTTGQIRDYVRNYIIAQIDSALINLSGIPDTFSTVFSPAAYNLKGNDITIDYADVQTIITLLNSAKSTLAVACAYNFDVNILNTINPNVTNLSTYNKATQGSLFDLAKVLQSNKNMGIIEEAGLLATAKSSYNTFVSSYNNAYKLMSARPVSTGHLFVLDNSPTSGKGLNTQKIDNGLNGITQVQNALNGPTTLVPKIVPTPGSKVYNTNYNVKPFKTYSAVWPSNNNRVDLSKFFNAGQPINLRTAFVDCSTNTLFEDKTIAGIYPLGYVTSPIYNDSPGWSSFSGNHGGWAIDPLVNLLAADKQTVINGLCK
jgi:hypothetical protein